MINSNQYALHLYIHVTRATNSKPHTEAPLLSIPIIRDPLTDFLDVPPSEDVKIICGTIRERDHEYDRQVKCVEPN